MSYDLLTVSLSDGRTLNTKWGDYRFGNSGGVVTWSMNLFGINGIFVSGPALKEFESAVQLAFDTWASVANVTFERQLGGDPDIEISAEWIDGSGNTLGFMETQWFEPIFDGDDIAIFNDVRIVFDTAESWAAIDSTDFRNVDFFAVALHEIGHALGLDHVDGLGMGGTLQNMNPFLSTDKLQSGDVDGIQFIYGGKVWTDGIDTANFTKVNGSQTVFAKGGNDVIDGSSSSDQFYGGAGSDTIRGAGGDDLIVDTRGDNDLFGGDNNDTIVGGGGRIDAEGNNGNDMLLGGIGNDNLNGGRGNDTLRGDPRGSFISGDDTLIAGSGDDWLEGGGGADVFIFNEADGNNRIGALDLSGGSRQIIGQDFEVGVDHIDLSDFDLSFSDVQSGLSTVNGNAVYTFDQGATQFTLTIEDVLHSELTTADFIL